MTAQTKSFTDILLEKGSLDQKGLEEALARQRKEQIPLDQILLKMQLVSKEDLLETMSGAYGVEYIDLALVEDFEEYARILPEMMCRRYQIVCISKVKKVLILAMANPLDIFALDDVRLRTGYETRPLLALATDIEEVINKAFGKRVLQEIISEMGEKELKTPEKIEQEVVIDAPLIRLVDELITDAVKMKASDIHIEGFEKEVKVRYRLDGVLQEMNSLPKNIQGAIVSRIKVLANMDIAERRLPQDGRIGLKVSERPIDLRVSTLPTQYGEGVAIRILDRASIMFTLDKLGLTKEIDLLFRAQIRRPNGIILVTGPTGSGKSTTLYAGLNAILSPEKKIITIEDPIEYNLYGVNQTQVNPEADFTFASGLRSFLRQDPDIIMVGEMRDFETTQIALESALTGHLVLSTLHTNNAVMAITRLIEMKAEPFLIASTLNCVLAQRLIRRVCLYCKTKVDPTPEVQEILERYEVSPEGVELVKGEGCPSCNQTGFKGRIGVFELVVMSENLSQLIMEKASSHKFMEVARNEGMKTMAEDGIDRVVKGMTTIEELMRVLSL